MLQFLCATKSEKMLPVVIETSSLVRSILILEMLKCEKIYALELIKYKVRLIHHMGCREVAGGSGLEYVPIC